MLYNLLVIDYHTYQIQNDQHHVLNEIPNHLNCLNIIGLPKFKRIKNDKKKKIGDSKIIRKIAIDKSNILFFIFKKYFRKNISFK